MQLNETQMRKDFEKWCENGGAAVLNHVFSFARHPNQPRYLEGTTEICWLAWRAALRAQADARPVAWRVTWHDHGGNKFGPRYFESEEAADDFVACEAVASEVVVPLYTHSEASAPGLSDDVRAAVRDAVAQALGDAYDCTRVWEAWSVGTMSQDDFELVAEDDNRVAEIADAAIDALTRASAATTTPSSVRKALQYALSELGKPPFGGVVDCTPIMQALIDTGGIDMNASAATVAEPSIPSGWRGRLQEMRDASYTYSQYPELAQAVFDSVIDALGEMEAVQSGQQAGVAEDAARLDWLDEQNRKKNASHGTTYGWGYSVNCNRIALEDHHWPARTVREAIDAAKAAAQQQAEHVGQACGDSAEHVGIQQAEPTVLRCISCGGAKIPQTLLTTGACECEQAESANGFTVEEVIADFERVHGAGSVRDYVAQQAEPGADEREEAGSLIGDGFVLEFERWNDVTGALPRNGSWLAEVSDIIQRAAQSGQRAGVAEDFLRICEDEAARASLVSLPLKLDFAKERGLRDVHAVHAWMVEAHRKFTTAVKALRAAAPTQQQEGGK